nr:uncharacterized protein C1683.06c-like isoform X1 [Osmia lignaria]
MAATMKVSMFIVTISLVLFAISIYFIIKEITIKTFTRSTSAVEKLIINTDAGADDAMAILLTLQSESDGFKVLAITCSYGNTYLDNVVNNVLKTLTIANRTDIPVYIGADRPLIQVYRPSMYFGSDGFGDFNFSKEITAERNDSKHAAIALIDLVKQHPGEITLLSLAPLTNIATTMTLEPEFFKYLKNHVILGGSVFGIGNVLPNIEFNFYQDPESNYITLNRTKTSVLLPWDTCVHSSISLGWRNNVLGKVNSTIMNFLNEAERLSLAKVESWISSDTMAAAVLLRPEIATRTIVTNVDPVLDGTARGSVLADFTNLTGRPENTRIILSFDVTAFKELLLNKLS